MNEVRPLSIFSVKELQRIVDQFPKTDPCSLEYSQLCVNLERFAASVENVDWVLSLDPYEGADPQIVQFNPPVDGEVELEDPEPPLSPVVEQDPAPVVEEETKVEETEYEMADVKKAVQKARMEGKLSSAKDWIRDNFGVDGFTAIPASRYGEVMEKLKELG